MCFFFKLLYKKEIHPMIKGKNKGTWFYSVPQCLIKMVFGKCMRVVCACMHMWNGSTRIIGVSSPREVRKGNWEHVETERKKKQGENRGLSSAFCHWQSQDLAALGSRMKSFCLGLESAPVNYLQLIMLQLLVFPFSLPSSQMIFILKNHSF